MNENKGAKGSGRDFRLFSFFRKLFMKKKIQDEELEKEKEKKKKKNATKNIVLPVEEVKDDVSLKDSDVDKMKEASVVVKQVDTQKETKKSGQRKKILFATEEVPVQEKSDVKKPDELQVAPVQDEIVIDKNTPVEIDYVSEKPDIKRTEAIELDSVQEDKEISKLETLDEKPEFVGIGDDKLDEKSEEKIEQIKEKPIKQQEKENTKVKDSGPLVEVVSFEKISEKTEEIISNDDIQKKMIEYLDRFVEDRRHELDKIKEEQRILEKQKDDILTSDEIEDLYKRLQELKEREEQILKEIKALSKDNTDLLNDPYFAHLVEKHKDVLKDCADLDSSFSYPDSLVIESFVSELIQLDEAVNQLEDVLGEKQKEQELRDLDFEQYEEDFEEYDKSFMDISKEIEESAKALNELEKQIANADAIVERTTILVKKTNIALTQLLVTFAMTKNNPLVPTTAKLLLRTAAVLHLISSIFHPKTEEKKQIKVTRPDFIKELQENINSLDDVFELLENTSEKVSDLKKTFKKELGDYLLPEYEDVLKKLDTLEKEIDEKRDLLLDTKEKLRDNLDKNKVLIKEKGTE